MTERENEKRNAPEGALSNYETETETNNLPPLYTEQTPGWEKLPRLVADALTGDDLDFNAHGVLTFLIGAVNWKTGVYRGTIRRLAEDIGWEHSENYLSKKLRTLRDGGWIDFESKSGQRSAYVIRLGRRVKEGQRNPPAYRPTSDSTSDYNPPSQSEVTSDSPNGTPAAKADAQPVSTSPQPQTTRSPQDVDVDVDRDADGDQPQNKAGGQRAGSGE
jgi:hypothetical protein